MIKAWSTVEFLRQVHPGDVLRFELEVAGWGETSFTLRQRARKVGDDGFAAESEIVCVRSAGTAGRCRSHSTSPGSSVCGRHGAPA